MRIADGRVARRIPSADPRDNCSSLPATAWIASGDNLGQRNRVSRINPTPAR
jgi:hypothetical protein